MSGEVSKFGSSPEPSISDRCIPLSQLRRGEHAVVARTGLEAGDEAMLGAMGLCAAARVTMCRCGEPFIVTVGAPRGEGSGVCVGTCRIGLSRALADAILVRVPDEAPIEAAARDGR